MEYPDSDFTLTKGKVTAEPIVQALFLQRPYGYSFKKRTLDQSEIKTLAVGFLGGSFWHWITLKWFETEVSGQSYYRA